MSNQALIDGLNEALNREISTVIRYVLQSSMIKGIEHMPLRDMYRAEAPEELGHAQYLADKIVMLGGVPAVKPNLAPPPADVMKMMANDVSAEQSDVAHYMKLAQLAEDAGDIELKMKMEEQAADEAGHAETLRRMQG